MLLICVCEQIPTGRVLILVCSCVSSVLVCIGTSVHICRAFGHSTSTNGRKMLIFCVTEVQLSSLLTCKLCFDLHCCMAYLCILFFYACSITDIFAAGINLYICPCVSCWYSVKRVALSSGFLPFLIQGNPHVCSCHLIEVPQSITSVHQVSVSFTAHDFFPAVLLVTDLCIEISNFKNRRLQQVHFVNLVIFRSAYAVLFLCRFQKIRRNIALLYSHS